MTRGRYTFISTHFGYITRNSTTLAAFFVHCTGIWPTVVLISVGPTGKDALLCCWILHVCWCCCCINSRSLQITHNNITFEIHFIVSMQTVNERVVSGPRRHFCGGRSRPVFAGNGRWCVGGVGGDFSHTLTYPFTVLPGT